jgi:hypothetical protein
MAWIAATLASTSKGQFGYERVTPAEASSERNIFEVADALYRELYRSTSKPIDATLVES